MAAAQFLTLVTGMPGVGRGNEQCSLVGLRMTDSKPRRRPSEWFESLTSVMAYMPVNKLLNLKAGRKCDVNAFRSSGDDFLIVGERVNAPFLRVFGGSVLQVDETPVPSLERVPLSQAAHFEPLRLISNIPWSGLDSDPLLTQVPTNAVLRTALAFGFGCSAGEDAQIGDFTRSVGQLNRPELGKAWMAFAGERGEKDDIVWYGRSAEEFAKAYFALVRSAAAQGGGNLPAIYFKGPNPNVGESLLRWPARGPGRPPTGCNAPIEDKRKLIEKPSGAQVRGTVAFVELAQDNLRLQYAARHLDLDNTEFVFPVSALRIDAENALGNIDWDRSTVRNAVVRSRTGGQVRATVIDQTATAVRYEFQRDERDDLDAWEVTFPHDDPFDLMRIMSAKKGSSLNFRLEARVGEGCMIRGDGQTSEDARAALEAAARSFLARAEKDSPDPRYVLLKEWEVEFNINVPADPDREEGS